MKLIVCKGMTNTNRGGGRGACQRTQNPDALLDLDLSCGVRVRRSDGDIKIKCLALPSTVNISAATQISKLFSLLLLLLLLLLSFCCQTLQQDIVLPLIPLSSFNPLMLQFRLEQELKFSLTLAVAESGTFFWEPKCNKILKSFFFFFFF